MNQLREWSRKIHFGTILGVIIALYIAVYLVQTVKRNYDLQQEIGGLEQQITDLRIEQDQLKYKIQYYQTESFKEKEARDKLGLQAPGESVIILPQDKQTEKQTEDQPQKTRKSNPEQWLDFLLGQS